MLDEQLDILSDARRRDLLLALSNETPRTVRTNTAAIQRTEERRDATRMYHIHLPKLEDCGYICWNKETERVTKGPKFAEIQPLLELVTEYEEEYLDSVSPCDSL